LKASSTLRCSRRATTRPLDRDEKFGLVKRLGEAKVGEAKISVVAFDLLSTGDGHRRVGSKQLYGICQFFAVELGAPNTDDTPATIT